MKKQSSDKYVIKIVQVLEAVKGQNFTFINSSAGQQLRFDSIFDRVEHENNVSSGWPDVEMVIAAVFARRTRVGPSIAMWTQVDIRSPRNILVRVTNGRLLSLHHCRISQSRMSHCTGGGKWTRPSKHRHQNNINGNLDSR